MFMGAMIMGPLAGWVIKKFDEAIDGKIKAGFEMLVNNFSVGILGMIMAILGYFLIGPFMGAILSVLTAGVQVLVDHSLLPLISIFVEPAKVLFLNNAINHGIFTPLGAEQVQAAGKSIFYMIEANPGSGTGVLLAYWLFSKDKTTKDSAPGALIIHLFGGIHEIYFPYVLMNPLLLLATIAGSVVTMFFNTIFNVGLVGPASPGSIIAFLAMAPKGSTFMVLISVVIAAAVSFVVAAPIVRMSNNNANLEEAKQQVQDMKAEAKGLAKQVNLAEVKEIVFACDAGMGSSAMGASVLQKKLKEAGIEDIRVGHASVSEVPASAGVVVCHKDLAERAKKSAPNAKLVTITNFMAAPEYGQLVEEIVAARK